MSRKILQVMLAALFLCLLIVPNVQAADQAGKKAPALTHRSFWDTLQFSVGFRWRYWEMTGDKNFTGSITADKVEEDIKYFPTNVNIQLLFCPYGGLVAEWDYFQSVMEKDGKLDWHVLTLGITARYPIHKRFIPYAVLGITYNFVNFNENNWWRYDFPSQGAYDDWMAQMPPDVDPQEWMRSYNWGMRNMETDPNWGWTFGVGFDFMITDHLALNADVRWFQSSTDVEYTIFNGNPNNLVLDKKFSYDLDTASYALGVRWYF